ncbi:MAG: cytochrome c-type biogenesis protein CcmH [Candidatus Dadabacteria bacterium]|nr:cytochrome c-type biogenesis protein CcmH [Candidatus Dadabacteria bacterium]
MLKKRVVYITALASFILGVLTLKPLADSIDDKVREISYLLMCPVCQGQTVAESNSELATQMRTIVRKKLEEGKSKEEIIAYFVARYGETILGAPPARGANWLLWALPALALVFGGAGVALFLRKSKSEKSKEENRKISHEPQVQAESKYLEKLNQELKKFES